MVSRLRDTARIAAVVCHGILCGRLFRLREWQAAPKPIDTRLGCDEGVCINVEGYWGVPQGGMFPITISGTNTDGTSTGFVVTGTRTTAWVDINSNGEVDPGEPVIQGQEGVVTANPPPNTGGATPMPGTINVSHPGHPGDVKIKIKVQIEYTEPPPGGGPPIPGEIERELTRNFP